ncbi:MAG: alpha/beta hydrolase [Maritimibacter sp.]
MSLRLRLISFFLRVFAKTLLRRAKDPARNRDLLNLGAKFMFRAPPYALYLDEDLVPGLSSMWISARPGSRPPRAGKVMLYLHGGGFIAGSPQTHRAMLARLAWMTGIEVCAPDYRISPEHVFPDALNDTRAAHEALIAKGYAPENILLGGDSAGGAFVLALLSELCAQDRRPAGVVCFTPVTDLTFSGDSMTENAQADHFLPPERKGDVQHWYLRGADPHDPQASPLFAEFDAPPPVYFQYSETEILRDDSVRMAAVLRAAGGEVVEDVWPDAPHVFPIFDGLVPEARIALQRMADFMNRCFA